jgi:hypothetical protein
MLVYVSAPLTINCLSAGALIFFYCKVITSKKYYSLRTEVFHAISLSADNLTGPQDGQRVDSLDSSVYLLSGFVDWAKKVLVMDMD